MGKVEMEAMVRPLLPPQLSEPQPTAASPEPTDEPRAVPKRELRLGPEISWKEARSSLQSMGLGPQPSPAPLMFKGPMWLLFGT